jgi:TolB-like protein
LFSGCYSASTLTKRDIPAVPSEKRLLVAVLDFHNLTGDKANDAVVNGMLGEITAELQTIKAFRLIERQRVETLFSEMKLGAMGYVDEATAKQIGKQLGVDAIITGNVSAVKNTFSKSSMGIMYNEARRTEVMADARLVKVETGEILASAKTNMFVQERKWVAFWVATLGKINAPETAVQTCVDMACKQIAGDLSAETYK